MPVVGAVNCIIRRHLTQYTIGGSLVQNTWSYAGDDDEDNVNFTTVQYFINYNLKGGWYLTSMPTITPNWAADNSDRWMVLFCTGAGRLIKIGNQPIDPERQVFYNAEKPHGASDLPFQFQVKYLFPK